jgi:hypothetical protein
VSNLNLSDGLKSGVEKQMKAGWYLDKDGVRVVQSMQRADGIQKGVETILTERGKFHDENGKKLKLLCSQCKMKWKYRISILYRRIDILYFHFYR